MDEGFPSWAEKEHNMQCGVNLGTVSSILFCANLICVQKMYILLLHHVLRLLCIWIVWCVYGILKYLFSILFASNKKSNVKKRLKKTQLYG